MIIASISCILLFALMLFVSFLMDDRAQDELAGYLLFTIGAAGFLVSFIWLVKIIVISLSTVHG